MAEACAVLEPDRADGELIAILQLDEIKKAMEKQGAEDTRRVWSVHRGRNGQVGQGRAEYESEGIKKAAADGQCTGIAGSQPRAFSSRDALKSSFVAKPNKSRSQRCVLPYC